MKYSFRKKTFYKKQYFVCCLFLSFVLFLCSCGKVQCDYSPLLSVKGSRLKLHRRQKPVLFVQEELMDITEEAVYVLEEIIGIPLFEIKPSENTGEGRTDIYISSDKAHYEKEKRRKEPHSYLAYCSIGDNFNKETGEIYESDIIFNPVLYNSLRDLYKKNRKVIRQNNEILEGEKEFLEKIAEYKKRCLQIEICSQEEYDLLEERQERYVAYLEDEDRWDRRDNKRLKNYIYYNTLLTMLHELGHALGYAHTANHPENIMYPINQNQIGVLTVKQINAVLCSFNLNQPSNL